MSVSNTKKMDAFLDIIRPLYPFIAFNFFYEDVFCRWKLSATTDQGGQRYKYEQQVDEEWIIRLPEVQVQPQLFNIAERMAVKITESIPEEVIGAYPFARLWHDRHLKDQTPLLFRPHREVMGWVFGTIKKASTNEYPIDKPRGSKKPNPQPLPEVEIPAPEQSEYDKQFESITKQIKGNKEMATNTKKRVVKKAPIKGFDPTKVKTPECKEHRSPMQFDHVEQKWRCTYEGCGMVARPKRDNDDKTVVLGQGGIQMRLIAQAGTLSVILISDDNIALDITGLVDTQEIMDSFDVSEQARVALEADKTVFDISQTREVGLSTRLLVMGADELTE